MAELTYANMANTRGVPLLQGNAIVDTTSGNLVVTLTPHLGFGNNWTGEFLLKILNQVISGIQPVVVTTEGSGTYKPLYLYNGIQATAAELETTGEGVLKCVYDASNGRLQVLSINI